MPRTSRVVLAKYPHHIIQRGHNKQVVFAATEDYEYYFHNLKEDNSGENELTRS